MLVEQLAEYAIRERTSTLPADVIHHAKRAVIDWTAAFLPGSLVPPATLLELALAEDLDHGGARLASGRRATYKNSWRRTSSGLVMPYHPRAVRGFP